MASANVNVALARRLLTTLVNDREKSLLKIDEYVHGIQDDPYMPDNADVEYKLLAKRAVTNVCDFVVMTPAQAMYVDQFRPSRETKTENGDANKPVTSVFDSPEWQHWQRSRLDARQSPVYRGALTYGHSFVVTEKVKTGKNKGFVISKGLSALRTSALFDDPANDEVPRAALTVTEWPTKAAGEDKPQPGTARMWDGKSEYAVTFKSTEDLKKGVTAKLVGKHGASECPVTRFTAAVDLEGRTCGVVAPMMPLQDRLNQTVFDMLIVQSFASFKVRTISGMAPPIKMKPINSEGTEVINPDENADEVVEWVPRLDGSGNPIPEPVNLTARRVFWAEDHDTNFGTLDETPLNGFIDAIKLAFQHMAALSQTPPHHLLGQIANLSAEALIAAETALARRVEEFKASFGESWERVFRVAAEIGEYEGSDDFAGEVLWRDMENRSLSEAGDALGKLAESLRIPARGLWSRVPNVTSTELKHWEELEDADNADRALAAASRRAAAVGSSDRPSFRDSTATSTADGLAPVLT